MDTMPARGSYIDSNICTDIHNILSELYCASVTYQASVDNLDEGPLAPGQQLVQEHHGGAAHAARHCVDKWVSIVS